MKRWMLTEPAFIGAALLASGSFITEDDLPEGPEPQTPILDDRGLFTGQYKPGSGKIVKSKPPSSAIEVDAQHRPVDKTDASAVSMLAAREVEIAPVAPHAPNPTQPQALPPHAIGEVVPAGNFVPAEGVESNADAAARANQRPSRAR